MMDQSDETSASTSETHHPVYTHAYKPVQENAPAYEQTGHLYEHAEHLYEHAPSGGGFLSMFVREVPYEYRMKRYRLRRAAPTPMTYEMDDAYRLRNMVAIQRRSSPTLISLASTRSTLVRNFMRRRARSQERAELYEQEAPKQQEDDVRHPLEVLDWDGPENGTSQAKNRNNSTKQSANQSVNEQPANVLEHSVDELEQPAHSPVDDPFAVGFSSEEEKQISEPPAAVGLDEFVNEGLEECWEEEVFCGWDKKLRAGLVLSVSDPSLIFESVEEKKKGKQKKKNGERSGKGKYYIGNDKHYAQEGRKVSLGTFGVQHSPLALRLDSRFFRANHSRVELKRLHRPELSLGPLPYQLVSQLVECPTPGIIKKASDLSLAQAVPFVLFEYSEESPFFISNAGMASLLNRYCRKNEAQAHEAQTHEAHADPHDPDVILLDADDDPFFGFSHIQPGCSQYALTNNLFTAPLFPHTTADLLCVVAPNRIYFRPVDSFYLVGQQFPKEEVFAPHSRRLNQFCKDFLKAATCRLFASGCDLSMAELDSLFPYFSEGSKRKWLKEYADCVKKGRENVWVPKGGAYRLGEETLRQLVTPENVCQYESMLVEEQAMGEAGRQFVESEEEGNDPPSWTLTRNFINATSGRGLLELTGQDGYFSFRRVRLKKGSEAENRRILNEQQATYKERGERIWARQVELLSGAADKMEANLNNLVSQTSQASGTALASDMAQNQTSPASDTGPFDKASLKRTCPDQSSTTNQQSIRIRRTYASGIIRSEVVTDPRIIKAYLKARKKLVEKKGLLKCSNCGQTGHMKTNKTCPNYMGGPKVSAKTERSRAETERKRAKTYLQEAMNKLISKFVTIPYSNAFHRPVSTKKFPNYPLIVKHPIDLSTMRGKVRAFRYKSFADFQADLKLMHDNCALYNGPTHSLTEIAANICAEASNYGKEHADQLQRAANILSEVRMMDASVYL